VTFDTDANGILHVSAKDLGTGKEQKIFHHRQLRSFQGRSGKDAARSRSARRRGQEGEGAIEIKNNADMLAYQSEKQLKEIGDKSPATRKSRSKTPLLRAGCHHRNDTDAMKRTYDDLQNKFQEVSRELLQTSVSASGRVQGRNRA